MSPAMVILVTGVLCASACAMLGSFLILRRAAMMSDAISHAILPGLVGGYFIAKGPNLLAGFAGAVLASDPGGSERYDTSVRPSRAFSSSACIGTSGDFSSAGRVSNSLVNLPPLRSYR